MSFFPPSRRCLRRHRFAAYMTASLLLCGLYVLIDYASRDALRGERVVDVVQSVLGHRVFNYIVTFIATALLFASLASVGDRLFRNCQRRKGYQTISSPIAESKNQFLEHALACYMKLIRLMALDDSDRDKLNRLFFNVEFFYANSDEKFGAQSLLHSIRVIREAIDECHANVLLLKSSQTLENREVNNFLFNLSTIYGLLGKLRGEACAVYPSPSSINKTINEVLSNAAEPRVFLHS